jgi:hypothetical protein
MQPPQPSTTGFQPVGMFSLIAHRAVVVFSDLGSRTHTGRRMRRVTSSWAWRAAHSAICPAPSSPCARPCASTPCLWLR